MNADTKAALLMTALTILTVAGIGQHDRISRLFPPDGAREWAAAAVSIIAAASLIVSIFHLLRVLRPKVLLTAFSRYSWPSVAAITLNELERRDSRTNCNEAWCTAWALAHIARRKFRSLQLGSAWWSLATIGLLTAIFLAR